jgi:hypothetical protein
MHHVTRSDPRAPITVWEERLDFGWWASNGPTAGYLIRLALKAAEKAHPAHPYARQVSLQVLTLPAAEPVEVAASTLSGPSDTGILTVTFTQGHLFALASLALGPPGGESAPSDASPPPALPREAYRPMVMLSLQVPPVTSHFEYRPTGDLSGRGPLDGWDIVWLTPTDHNLSGQDLVASMIDSWYPPSFISAVRAHLRDGGPLRQPAPGVLTSATVSFPASRKVYDSTRHALLANQITATTDGYCFERSEIWSDTGDLLATAELIRRMQGDGRTQ